LHPNAPKQYFRVDCISFTVGCHKRTTKRIQSWVVFIYAKYSVFSSWNLQSWNFWHFTIFGWRIFWKNSWKSSM